MLKDIMKAADYIAELEKEGKTFCHPSTVRWSDPNGKGCGKVKYLYQHGYDWQKFMKN